MKKDETIKGLAITQLMPTTLTYVAQCMDEEFVTSQKGHMMMKRKWQILQPDKVPIDGAEVDIAGTELMQYRLTKFWDKEKQAWDERMTRKVMSYVFDEYETVGESRDDINPEQPELVMKGKVCNIAIENSPFDLAEKPTAEQIAAGQKRGDIKKGDDGKPIKGYNRQIARIYSVNKDVPSVAF